MQAAEGMTFEDLVDWYVRQLVLHGDEKTPRSSGVPLHAANR